MAKFKRCQKLAWKAAYFIWDVVICGIFEFLFEYIIPIVIFLCCCGLVTKCCYELAHMKCEYVHNIPVKQEHLERCAPVSNFTDCLNRLGYDSKQTCKSVKEDE